MKKKLVSYQEYLLKSLQDPELAQLYLTEAFADEDPRILLLALKNIEDAKTMYTTPAYVGILLKKDNQVFLVKRRNTDWAAEKWNFPGGSFWKKAKRCCKLLFVKRKKKQAFSLLHRILA